MDKAKLDLFWLLNGDPISVSNGDFLEVGVESSDSEEGEEEGEGEG